MTKSRFDSDKKSRTRDVSVAGTVRFGDSAKNVAVGGNVISTEGGAYIAGRVETGGGDFIGRDQVTTGVSANGFLQILKEIRALLHRAGLDPKITDYIAGELDQVEQQARSNNPSAPTLVSKLESVASLVGSVAGPGVAARQLPVLLKQGVVWAQRLFA